MSCLVISIRATYIAANVCWVNTNGGRESFYSSVNNINALFNALYKLSII